MLYPMAALVLLTLVVMVVNFIWRVRSVKSCRVSIKYYRVFEGEAPEYIKAGSRHYANLFELPVLFYVAGVAAISLGLETQAMITLAWLFVLARAIHALVHMSYNNVLHRLAAFWLGVISVAGLWLTLVISYANIG